MKIAIIGRTAHVSNYESFAASMHATPLVTLSPGELSACRGLILPGGGDITPAFFGEADKGSKNIDTELDILQFQALDYAIRRKLPVLGICKGMQVINVAFGGTLVQDLPTAALHSCCGRDQYHPTVIAKHSCLHRLFGEKATVNSAHHQGVGRLGNGLEAIQWSVPDGCVEAVVHKSLPILGLQWHPERLKEAQATLSGEALAAYFAALIKGLSDGSDPERASE